MYRCDVCNKVTAAGTPQIRMVVDTREKTYDITPKLSDKEKRRARRRGMNIDHARQYAQGWEIVNEITVCPTCHASKPELAEALENQLAAHGQRGVQSAEDVVAETDAPAAS